MKNKFTKINKSISLAQVIILILGIVAISWAIGGEVRVVKAVKNDESCEGKLGQTWCDSATNVFYCRDKDTSAGEDLKWTKAVGCSVLESEGTIIKYSCDTSTNTCKGLCTSKGFECAGEISTICASTDSPPSKKDCLATKRVCDKDLGCKCPNEGEIFDGKNCIEAGKTENPPATTSFSNSKCEKEGGSGGKCVDASSYDKDGETGKLSKAEERTAFDGGICKSLGNNYAWQESYYGDCNNDNKYMCCVPLQEDCNSDCKACKASGGDWIGSGCECDGSLGLYADGHKCTKKKLPGITDVTSTVPTPAPAESFAKTWGTQLLNIIPGLGAGLFKPGEQIGSCSQCTEAKKTATRFSKEDVEEYNKAQLDLKKCYEDNGCNSAVKGSKYFWSSVLSAATLSAVATTALQLVKANSDEHAGLYDALSAGATSGFMIGGITSGAVGALMEDAAGWELALSNMIPALFVGAFVFAATYKEEREQKKSFINVVWGPPLAGKNCNVCNKMGIIPCSEYMCRSLGTACQLVNPGTKDELCVWINQKDVNPPQINPWEDALPSKTEAGGSYSYVESTKINPPDRGVQILFHSSKGGTDTCLPPFNPISFGITTDEPAACKVDYEKKGNYENMTYMFGGSSFFLINHTQVMTLPSPDALAEENLTYTNGGDFEMFVRCQDANGNSNTADFVFQFCVSDGPDSTPPIIVATDPLNGMPFAYNTSKMNVSVYTNEPAICKWSFHDQTYDVMNNTMGSSDEFGDKTTVNGLDLYKHIAWLQPLKSDSENKFYFRCVDKYENKNTESYAYTIMGTKPLSIIEWGPNGTIKDSTDPVKVVLTAKTFGGYSEGVSTCYYKEKTQAENQFVQFFTTGAIDHSQDLYLGELLSPYNYEIKCVDFGGNADRKNITFSVDSDTASPVVTRLYYENDNLVIKTNEKSECVYDTVDCTYYYDNGIAFTVLDEKTHFTEWKNDITLYVKCKDVYGNEPFPQETCTIKVKPFDVVLPLEEFE